MGNLLNKIRTYILLAVFLICFLAYLLVYQPLKIELKKSKQDSFVHSAEAVAYAVEIFVDDCLSGISGISNNRNMKQKISEYRSGKINLDEFQGRFEKAFGDMCQAFKNIDGAFRVVDGQIIAQTGKVNLALVGESANIVEPTLKMEYDSNTAVIYSPIKLDNEILGYDIAFFDLSKVLDGVHEEHMSHKIYPAADVQDLLAKHNPIEISEGEYLITDSETTCYIKWCKNADAYFVASSPNVYIYRTLRGIAARILFASPVILFGLVVTMNYFTFKSFGQLVYKLERTNEVYKKYASTDCLTNTFSRHYFNDYIRKQPLEQGLVVMIDIDDFKVINDTYGHITGDKVLQELAAILKESVREGDLLVRYGGDELLLILQNCSMAVGEEIMSRVEKKIRENDKFDFGIEISYGIAMVKNKREFLSKLEEADKGMYKMKRNKTAQ
jgi:diguanylate cyclase (GGDEF)-like protein